MAQALMWSVGAELVRRHPKQIALSESAIHQYGIALIPYELTPDGWRPLIFLTPHPSHLTPALAGWDERFNWVEVLLTPKGSSIDALVSHVLPPAW